MVINIDRRDLEAGRHFSLWNFVVIAKLCEAD